MKNRNHKLAALITLSLLLAAAAGQAAEQAWTTSGSSGTKVGQANLHLGMASRTGEMSDGTTILRYNIVATDGLVAQLRPDQQLQLELRYRADKDSRVRAFVREAAMNSDRTNTLVAFDSDQAVEAAGVLPFQYRLAKAQALEGRSMQFDFDQNVYYLEVWLTKIGNGFGASIAAASISATE